MRLSVSVTNYSWPHREIRARLAALADTLDDSAVDTLWVADHLLQADPSSRVDEPMLEAYTALGFLAARTSRLRLGTMVTAATFRAAALLIKAVTTLDVLTDGRAWLGIGAPCAWSPSTATPAICSTFPTAARPSGANSRCWRGIVQTSADPSTRWNGLSAPHSNPVKRSTDSRAAAPLWAIWG